MKTGDVLLGAAAVLAIVGVVLYFKSQKKVIVKAPAAKPVSATTTADTPGLVSVIAPVPVSADITQASQMLDSGSGVEMQSFIR